MPTNYLTRIKNNQITDSTIFANTKIYPGSIVGSLFNSNLTMTSDVTITGNLTVQGSSTYLTVASTNTYVNDPLIILNNAFSGTNAYDIGLLFNRGNQVTTALIWHEDSKSFQLINTTDDGTTYGVINNSGFANLKVGNLTVEYASTINSLTTTGDINAVNANLSGDLLIAGGDLTANTSSFNLLNSTVTDLNFAGAGTNIVAGATTGTFNLRNANIYLPNATTVYSGQTTVSFMNEVPTTVNAFGAATALTIGATTGTLAARNANIWLPNATTVDGAQATIAVFNLATTVDAFKSATDLEFGATTGTLTINNPTVVGTQSTQNLFNTTATTLNFAGATTALTIGATSGYANIRNATTNIIGNATVGGTLAVTGDTTLTGDLAVNGGDLTTTAGTFNLVNTNATTVNFAGAATTIGIGATSGTLTINNPTVVGTQSTQNLYNTTATTMNFAGAASTLVIGATTGTANIRNATTNIIGNATVGGTLTVTGAVTFTDDLAVNGGDLTTTASTFNLIDTNATTVNFARAASTFNIGANSGTLTIGNPTVVGTQSTQNLYNTVATTLNAFGAVTTANIGAGTGTFTINNPTLVGQQPTQNLYNTLATTMNFAGDATTLVMGGTSGTASLRNANIWLPNATTLDGAQATVGIFNLATTVDAFKSATDLELGATSGTLTVNNPTVVGTQSTQTLWNTTATTVNAFGAATSVITGATTGTFNIRNANLYLPNATTLYSGQSTFSLLNENVTTLNAFGAASTLVIGATTGTANIRNATTNIIGNATVGGTLAITGLLTLSDDLAVNGGDITTTASSATVFNTNATTVGAFGAATTLTLGGTTGTVTLRNAKTEVSGNLQVDSTLQSTTYSDGALTVAGGVGITKNLNVGGAVGITGVTTITDTTAAINATSGALIVAGGIGANANSYFGANVTIDGSLRVNGNVTYINSNVVNINDAMIYLADDNPADTLDIGLVSSFTSDKYQHTGFVRDATDGVWKLFANVVAEPTTVVDFTNANYSTLKVGNLVVVADTTSGNLLTLNSGTPSTSTTNGALIIGGTGGIGLGGNLWMGGPDLATSASTINVINTNATTVNAFGAATTLNVGANSGTLTIGNPTVVGTQSTQNLYNTVATTLNGFGAATTMTLGATSGLASIRNAVINFPNATDLVTAQTSLNVFNANVTTMNLAGAATALNIGASTGTLTANNANIWMPNATTIDGAQTSVSLLTQNATTLSAFTKVTSANVGAGTGTFTINNPTLVGQQATQNLYNTVATTMNFAGAATNLVVGATTGTASLQNANIWLPNATTLDGAQATVGVFNNATTVDVFKAGTDIEIGATTGTLTINNPTVVGTQSTQNLYNTTATTLNFAGAGTAITIGATSGTTTIRNALTAINGNATVGGDTTLTGDLAVNGGDLTTSASTFNLLSVNATTVNAFGAATTLTLGSTSGTASLLNANIWVPNATTLDGAQTTISLFTNATTIDAFKGATDLEFGATSGTLLINNPTVYGSQTTQNLYNTVATTLNLAGDATSVVAGATTGTFNIRNANLYLPNATTIFSGQTSLAFANTVTTTLNIGGDATAVTIGGTSSTTNMLGGANIKATTPSTTTTTGALVVNGGTGIVGNLNVGGNAVVNGLTRFTNTTSSTSYNNGAIVASGGVGLAGNLNVKSGSHITVGGELIGNQVYTEDMVQVTGNVANLAARISIQNINTEQGAVAEFMAMADNGSNLEVYTATGITNSTFNKGYFIKENEGFTYSTANLAVFSLFDKVTVAAGGFKEANIIATFNNTTSNVSIVRTTQATSTTTGALTVAGGVGVAGNIWVAKGAVFNDAQTSDNFTIKGVTSTAVFHVDSSQGAVVIGGTGDSASGGNINIPGGTRLKIDSTDTMMVPVGSTAQRPSNTGNVDVAGMVRFNTTTNLLEFYTGESWASTSGEVSYNIITSEQFIGDGANLSFTMSNTATTNSTIISINGILQIPTISYSVTGANLTFTEAPAVGDVIDVRKLTTTQVVNELSSDAGWQRFVPTDTSGAEIYSGSGSPVLRAVATKDGDWAFKNGTKVTYDQTATNVNASATPTIIDTFNANSYTTAKYVVQIKDGTKVQSMEALAVHDGANVYLNTYGIVDTAGDIGSLSGNIVSGNVHVYYTSTSLTNSNVKVYSTYIV